MIRWPDARGGGQYSNLEINLDGNSKDNIISYLKSLDQTLEIKNAEEDTIGITFTLKTNNERELKDKLFETFKKNNLSINTIKRQEVTLEQMFLTNL